MILTARRFESIPARLRELSDFIVDSEEVETGGIVYDLFLYYTPWDYMSLRRRARIQYAKFLDVMIPTTKMPQELWDKMMEVRRSLGMKRLDMVIKALEAREYIELEHILKIREKVEKVKKKIESEAAEEVEEE